MLGGSTQSPPRRLVLCCDGTWNSADGGEAATNVVRMARCVRPTASNGATQIAYYHPGVGTGNGLDRLIGGVTGVGLARNVRDAYAFIVNNYVPGDEIFLFGFSRGAYTARSVSGLIDEIGLLAERDMGGFLDAWAFFRMPDEQKKRHQAAFERRFQGRATNVPIRCIGVWDTVGALGIPANRWLGRLQLCRANYRFLSVKLCPAVEHAFQALAIDERRQAFAPAVWQRDPAALVKPDCPPGLVCRGACRYWRRLRAAWRRRFVVLVDGGAGVGAWELLDLDPNGIAAELDRSEDYENATLHQSLSGIYRLLGLAIHRKLRTGVNEAVHQSVLDRIANPGPAGYDPHQKTEILKMAAAPVSPIERQFAWTTPVPTSRPGPLFPEAQGWCDKVVRWLGGG